MTKKRLGSQGNQNGKPGKPEKKTHPHREMSFTVHLDARYDKDLITAFGDIEPGDRAPKVKTALRSLLDAEGSFPASLRSDSSVIQEVREEMRLTRADLDWIKGYMHGTLPGFFEQLVRWMQQNPGVQPAISAASEPTGPTVSEEKLKERGKGIKRW
jgi:hypothetical protein